MTPTLEVTHHDVRTDFQIIDAIVEEWEYERNKFMGPKRTIRLQKEFARSAQFTGSNCIVNMHRRSLL